LKNSFVNYVSLKVSNIGLHPMVNTALIPLMSHPVFRPKLNVPLCVSGSSFTHKATNSGINIITSVYYIISYYKYFLQVQEGLSSGKDTIMAKADDQGFHTPRCLHQSTHLLSSIAQQQYVGNRTSVST
jgi:hypothetical protein